MTIARRRKNGKRWKRGWKGKRERSRLLRKKEQSNADRRAGNSTEKSGDPACMTIRRHSLPPCLSLLIVMHSERRRPCCQAQGFNAAATLTQVNSAWLKVERHRWKKDWKRGKFVSASRMTTLRLDTLESVCCGKVCCEMIGLVKVVDELAIWRLWSFELDVSSEHCHCRRLRYFIN